MFFFRKPKRVILISLDTLRPDHLGLYGCQRATSPNLDDFAKAATVFWNAHTPIPYTSACFPAIFYAQYPSKNPVKFTPPRPFKLESTPEFFTLLKKKGVKSAAFVSSIVLSQGCMEGIEDFFDFFDDELPEHEANRPETLLRRADQTLKVAKNWIAQNRKENFFLWIHLMDIHGPYTPPKEYENLFLNDQYTNPKPKKLTKIIEDCSFPFEKIEEKDAFIPAYQVLWKGKDDCETDVETYTSRYDANIRFVDDQLGKFFQFLRKLGIFNDSLILIHSDHGEAFGEENIFFFHGLTTTPDQIRIPLLTKYPKQKSTIEIYSPASNLDIIPTISHHLGIPLEYRDGLPVDRRCRENFERIVFSQLPRSVAVISYPFHLNFRIGTLGPGGGVESEQEHVFKLTGELEEGMITEERFLKEHTHYKLKTPPDQTTPDKPNDDFVRTAYQRLLKEFTYTPRPEDAS